uniref:Fungal lipase-like domain-containing protein n=1 Tax=Acrobeloides nanus TaxID=290746 RepID=A0A914DXY1_9BILA
MQFYYNGFLVTWNGGLRDALLSAKNSNPTYELWVVGWSMGGSLSAIAAPYISQMGYYNAINIKLVTFGELRMGYMDFATRFPSLVSYSYRVVHKKDLYPHLIPYDAGYRHHVNEVS